MGVAAIALAAWALVGTFAVSLCVAAARGDRTVVDVEKATPEMPPFVADVSTAPRTAPARVHATVRSAGSVARR